MSKMSKKKDSDEDFELFRNYSPKKAAGMYINYYISNQKNENKGDLESLAENISKIGIEKITKIYDYVRKEISFNISIENYKIAHELQKAANFYRMNVLSKAREQEMSKPGQENVKYASDKKKIRKYTSNKSQDKP